ncbi:MAG: T9SS type A sorting domain-containing protein, partial [Bacteroidota bacterium]
DLSENEYTKLYQNEAGTNIYASNTLPEPPGGLNTVVNGQSVSFSWEKAVDAETPQDGLCYNIRLGLHSGESDIITPMADNESGYRYIQAIGNTNMQNEWTITRLEAGTYYWSVQTIDQAYSGSEFAAEETFQIIETGVNELNDRIDVDIYPNPATDKINIQFTHPGEIDIHILNTNGQLIQTETISSGDAVDISLLEEGVYFLYIDNGSKRAVREFIKH